MSAINPASFASPSLGLQAPSGIGPGAIGVSRTPTERRPQPTEQPSCLPGSRGYQGPFPQPFVPNLDRGSVPPTAYQPPTYTYGFPASPFNVGPRASPFVPVDQYGGFSSQVGYQGLPPRYPSPNEMTSTHDASEYGRNSGNIPASNEGWVNSFQGLSMNSR